MSKGDNWTKDNTSQAIRKKADIVLKELKEKRKGKFYRYEDAVINGFKCTKEIEISEKEWNKLNNSN